MKKIFSSLLLSLFTILSIGIGIGSVEASCSFLQYCPNSSQIQYCQDGKCTLSGGLIGTRNAVGNLFSQKTIAKYTTDVVRYFLGFVTLVAVAYIIYAGVQLMTGAGDEEKVKKARQIIIYVIIGIIVIWMAYYGVILVLNAIK